MVHEHRQQLDRAHHHCRRGHQLHWRWHYEPACITAGPDGNLWFTNHGSKSIGQITVAGVVSNYTGTGINSPDGITVGPDGALWFTNSNSIGRMTTAGTYTNYSGIIGAHAIASGSDGALWFTKGHAVGRITTTGARSTVYRGTNNSATYGIAAGPDGALWFTVTNSSIGRIATAVTPAIVSFTPTSGAVRTTVTITGHNLTGASEVTFNGTPAAVVSDTATTVVTAVPAGASVGQVSVTTAAGTATSTGIFSPT